MRPGSRPMLTLNSPFLITIQKKFNDLFRGLKVSSPLQLHGFRCKLYLGFILERKYYECWSLGWSLMGDRNNRFLLLWNASRVSFCFNNLTKYFFRKIKSLFKHHFEAVVRLMNNFYALCQNSFPLQNRNHYQSRL